MSFTLTGGSILTKATKLTTTGATAGTANQIDCLMTYMSPDATALGA